MVKTAHSTAQDMGSAAGQGTKILDAVDVDQKKKKKKEIGDFKLK